MIKEEKYKLTLFTLIRNQMIGRVENHELEAVAYRTMQRLMEMVNYPLAKEDYEKGKKMYEGAKDE